MVDIEWVADISKITKSSGDEAYLLVLGDLATGEIVSATRIKSISPRNTAVALEKVFRVRRPSVCTVDFGSVFSSKLIEEVTVRYAVDLRASRSGAPLRRGKIERMVRKAHSVHTKADASIAVKRR